ncbi:putative GCN5-related N-acetyltransferase [Actinoplanes friuliensis DSM 7358]|uniref:Putative GCN5-related N-acetyltransferase n=2 Tax=Actinoplanes friuliensis TaxID=196914 RepID=U5W5X4_9ACTN|nr:putative GCN5-related N-acetyltransferase [Actinoplanes friuliensis DSM 7358]
MRLRTVMIGSSGPWLEPGREILERQLTDPRDLVAAFVVDRPDGPGLASCVVGAIDERLPGPRDPTGLRGYVYNVATDPQYRRRGYSRACMAALIHWYAHRGITVVDLRATPDGEGVYASLGFERTKDPAMRLLNPGR